MNREGERLLRRLARDLMRSDEPTETFSRAAPELTKLVDDSNRLARRMKLTDCVEELRAPGTSEPAPS